MTSLASADKPRKYNLLESRTQDFTRAMVSGNTRDIYRLFIPAFRAEHGFARFDSAVKDWQAGRAVQGANSKVVDVHGLGGHVSTWVRFEGERDESYVYQSWLFTGAGWQLLWVSNLIDQTFQYGRADTGAIEAVVAAGLDFIVNHHGLAQIRRGVEPPDTVFVVHVRENSDGPYRVGDRPVVWLPGPDYDSEDVNAEILFRAGQVRVFGDVALCPIDVKPTDPRNPGRLGRRRGIELYLVQVDGEWQVQAIGKVW